MHQYRIIETIGEGTFSRVYKGQSIRNGNYVALKLMKQKFANIEEVYKLREIQALKKVTPHDNIIRLIEVLYSEQGNLALVFELMEQNLYEFIRDKKTPLKQQTIKTFIYQLLQAINHIHKKGIFHRDVKPENILLLGDKLKLADFGSCKGIFSPQPYSEYISTRWYRSPECLMTDGYYDHKMDIWGIGCVMFEIMALEPLFPGKNELDQVHLIHNILGTPALGVLDRFKEHSTHMVLDFPHKDFVGFDNKIPNAPKDALDLMYRLLTYDPNNRISAEEALHHPYFKEFQDIQNLNFFDNSKQTATFIYEKNQGDNKQQSYISNSFRQLQFHKSIQQKQIYFPQHQFQSLENSLSPKGNLYLNDKIDKQLGSNPQLNFFLNCSQTNQLSSSIEYSGLNPVLSIKRAKPKKRIKPRNTLYQQDKLVQFSPSFQEDDISNTKGFLPPIRPNYFINLYSNSLNLKSTKAHQTLSNPFKQTMQNISLIQKKKKNKDSIAIVDQDYLIQGKKAQFI